MSPPVICWFQQDLRLEDNRALAAALASGRPVLPLYILDDETPGAWASGRASRWWLHHSLDALRQALRARGSDLILRRGPTQAVLDSLIDESGAGSVAFSRRYEPHARALETALATGLTARGIEVKRYAGSLLIEPEAVATKDGRPYKVFTPFYKACLEAIDLGSAPRPLPKELPRPDALPAGDALDDWGLLPRTPDWAGGLRETWTPGEAGALQRLESFLEGPVAAYGEERDRPDREGTSRLSPHLHFGELSPRLCWQRAQRALETNGRRGDAGIRSFLRELVWREFSSHLLFHWPELPEAPFRPAFARFPWAENPEHLAAWQRGLTGYPIVDAGMRQLWHTGWMHNRVRMVVASFLVKHLLIPWQAGEAWFWDTLVDADLANNAASWQWVAGCGADAAPYFRIFNPVLQGEKFDPQGTYVRRWVPELSGLPDSCLHKPWAAGEEVLRAAGIALGRTYPKPMVEHAAARARALEAFATIKG